MELPIAKQLKEALATIKAHEATIATLTTERDQATQGTQAAIDAAVKPLNETIATLTTERDQAKTDLDAANATIATKDQELATLTKEQKTAGQRAVDIAASQSTKPVGEDKAKEGNQDGGPAKTAEELLAEYRACTGDHKERAAIWAKYQAALK